ncbi:hypothetical protein ACTOVN_05145 [Arcanobacterium canis]
MKKGTIVEEGTFGELLSHESEFKQMFHSQLENTAAPPLQRIKQRIELTRIGQSENRHSFGCCFKLAHPRSLMTKALEVPVQDRISTKRLPKVFEISIADWLPIKG